MFFIALQSRQKLGMILVSNFNKKCATKLLFFIEKKISKIMIMVDIENSFCKSDFGTF